MMTPPKLLVGPSLDDPSLYQTIEGVDQDGRPLTLSVVTERMLSIFLNGREVVTAMTIGDHPTYLALGFLLNQRMLTIDDTVLAVDHDPELGTVMVRTDQAVRPDDSPRRRIHTSGCAVGTLFGGVMESLDDIRLDPAPRLRTSWVRSLVRRIEGVDSLHTKTGALHRCVLCQEGQPLVYMEDVGRHNAIDKIAGYMFVHGVSALDKSLYTTGRLTSEVVIKTVIMGIPILISRSGFTALGVELARKTDLTMIGRCRGRFFQVLSGAHRVVFDAAPSASPHDKA
jgi:FdhD protein